jgi:choline dehydrogenase-like flavoprotein
MGAAVARIVRDEHPHARIVMVDGAPPIGSVPGQHLHDSTEPEIRERYNKATSSDVQALYVGPEVSAEGGKLEQLEPGVYRMSAFGEDARQMPGAAVAWNIGGMSVHWTASTPLPWGAEEFDFGLPDQWQKDLREAQRLLHVHENPYGVSPAGRRILQAMEEQFGALCAAGRHPQVLPMALSPEAGGRWLRTGPNRIFPAIGSGDDPNFVLLAGTQARTLMHDGRRVSGARLHVLPNHEELLVAATLTIVCADAVRTPQLLFASGIRPPALGCYLNEHAFLGGRVLPDLRTLGISRNDLPQTREGEWRAGAYWIPHSGASQPYHGQIVETFLPNGEDPDGYVLGLTVYVPTEIRKENRLEFSELETDVAGLPLVTVAFDYSDRDRELIEKGRVVMAEMARCLGPFEPSRESELLEPGSSLHYTGTVRMGALDDGTSVCDADAKVWGFENLFVAGNGVVPTALVCNSTLTGIITAVRAGRAAAASLATR